MLGKFDVPELLNHLCVVRELWERTGRAARQGEKDAPARDADAPWQARCMYFKVGVDVLGDELFQRL